MLAHILRALSDEIEPAHLPDDEGIRNECEQLLQELEPAERDALIAFVNTGQVDAHQQHLLDANGLIVKSEKGFSVFTPLLADFIKRSSEEARRASQSGLRVDAASGQIFVNGQEVTLGLSEPQRQFLRLMNQNAARR